ncbi:MAG: UPF0175 family protein [Methanosarcinales archaeon]
MIQTTISIPEDILFSAKIRERQLQSFIKKILAVELYREGLLSLGKAAEFAGVETRWEMMTILKEKGVPLHYTIEDVKEDLDALNM